jgi:hypothetical protein
VARKARVMLGIFGLRLGWFGYDLMQHQDYHLWGCQGQHQRVDHGGFGICTIFVSTAILAGARRFRSGPSSPSGL